ncbi:MAG: hypothetical protein ACK59M_14620 [Pseudomonadota bacterium]
MAEQALIEQGPDSALAWSCRHRGCGCGSAWCSRRPYTGLASPVLFTPGGGASWPMVVPAWAAAFVMAELLRFGRPELTWSPRGPRLRKRLLLEHGALPFSPREWRPGTAALVRVAAGRGDNEAAMGLVCLDEADGPPVTLF